MLRIDRGFPGFRGLLRGGFVFCALALLIPTACGSSSDDPPPTDPSDEGRGGNAGEAGRGGTSSGTGGSNGGSGGTGDTGGTGGEGGEPPNGDPLAPVVSVTSPEEIGDPEDGVLVNPEVDVVCEATQSTEEGSEPVNPSTVVIQMLSADGDVIDEKPGTETETDVYTARFVLTTVPNGVVSFRCSAEDASEPPLVGSQTISTFVDHGPVIEVIRPEPDSAHPLLGDIAFDFTVTPELLAEEDSGAEVDAVSLEVMGVDIPLDEHSPGEFRASVTLSDTTMFPDRTMTVPVLIRATNARSPEPAERQYPYTILIDEQGPTISITAPGEEDVVGQTVELKFTVVDDLTEVDDATVSVAVNRGTPVFFDPDPLSPWSKDGNGYIYKIDTTTISGSVAQMTVNVNARDVAGNQARGESIVLFLDNQAPIVDLDPPYVREAMGAAPPYNCSIAFDPVGDFSVNDLQSIPVSNFYRALVWEETNRAEGQRILYYSSTDETSVYIYALDQVGPDNPLLTDTNGDGVCDEVINRQSLKNIHLSPIPVGGSSWYGAAADEPAGAPPLPMGCTYQDGVAPRTLCDNRSDMSRSISHTMDGRPPVIYALGSALGGTGSACTGTDWELDDLQPGWVCVAGRAEDLVGNVGVSRPLRLCLDNAAEPPSCPLPAPSCLDGCTLPPAFAGGTFEP